MSSELELLKQRITELEAKNDKLEAENAELRKENTEIRDLRFKLSVSDVEIAELKRRNAETLQNIMRGVMLKIPNSGPESRSWNLRMLSLEIDSRKWNRSRLCKAP